MKVDFLNDNFNNKIFLKDNLTADNNFFSEDKKAESVDFGKMFMSKIQALSNQENQFNVEKNQYLNGERDDIQNIMIDGEKAALSLSLAVKVKDKMLEAYQELSKMQF